MEITPEYFNESVQTAYDIGYIDALKITHVYFDKLSEKNCEKFLEENGYYPDLMI